MKWIRTLLLISGFFLIPSAYALDAPFDRLQNNAWALVVTGAADNPLYIEQMAILTPAANDLIDREIVVIHFKDRSLNLFPELSVFPYRLPVLRENKDTNLLEELLFTDDDIFSVVLVGKDGATKYVWNGVVTPEQVFNMIDHPVPMVFPAERPGP